MLRHCLFSWIILPLAFAQALQAQEQSGSFFEGTLTFSVELSGPQAQALEENKPNNKMVMHIKGGDYIIQLMGGQYPKTFMYISDSNREYVVDASNQVAYRYSPYADRIREDAPIQWKPSGKSATIQGEPCEIILARTPDTYFYYYVSDQYRVDLAAFPDSAQTKASFLIPGLEGRIPLKTIKKQQGLTVTTTLVAAKPQRFNPKQFLIPPSFAVRNRDYRY